MNKPWLRRAPAPSAPSLLLSLAALLLLAATEASAQQCASDADCNDGYSCRIETQTWCYDPGSCGPDGGGCGGGSEAGSGELVCETYESSWCTYAACESDNDCAGHMACTQQTTWECDGGGAGGSAGGGVAGAGGTGGGTGGGSGTGSGGDTGGSGGCDPDGNCDMPTCQEVPAGSLCIPRHELPCESASDCGGGFDCVESYYWVCSGGGEAGGGAAGTGVAGMEAPPDIGGSGGRGEDYECEQVPSGESYCQLQDLPCDADAQCPAGLSCVEQYVYPPCDGGMAGDGSGGIGSCPEPELVSRCVPQGPGGDMGGGTGGVGGSGGSGGSGGGSGGDDPDDGGFSGSGGTSGTGGGVAGAGGSSAGSGGGAEDEDDESEEAGDDRPKRKGLLRKLLRALSLRDCSAGGASGGDPLGALLLGVSLIGLRLRARRR